MAIKPQADLALDRFIHIFPGVIAQDDCRKIMDLMKDVVWDPAGSGSNSTSPDLRNCDTFDISSRKEQQPWEEVHILLFRAVNTAWKSYYLQHLDSRINIDTGYEILRYPTGTRCLEHVDSYDQRPRTVSCSIALNDNYQGGRFTFFDGQIRHRVPAGSALMFPSNFMYPHGVEEITRGTRYSIITWLA